MAREYGKVLMSAWTDRDFTALTRRAQGTYFFLVSQSDLNRAGVLTMALNRWASRCAENDRRVIVDDLAELARARFVVVDEVEEEVLVRTYIRGDEGWKSPNIMVAIASAARQISSETLRSVIADELTKIDTSGLSTTVNAKTGRSTKDFIELIISESRTTLDQCTKDPGVMAWGTLNGTLSVTLPKEAKSGTLTERVSRGFLTTPETTPETSTTPEPETSPSAIAAIDDDFEAFWDVYDKKRGRKATIAKWRLALKKPGVTPELLTVAASAYIVWQRSEGKHPEYTKDPASWLYGEHWNDERSTRVQSGPKSTTDERVRATLAIADRLREQERNDQPNLRAIGQTS